MALVAGDGSSALRKGCPTSRRRHVERWICAQAGDRAVAYPGIFVELVTGALRDGDFFSHLRVTQHREQYGAAKDVAAQCRQKEMEERRRKG